VFQASPLKTSWRGASDATLEERDGAPAGSGRDLDDLPVAVLATDGELRALGANRAWQALAAETSSPTDGAGWLAVFEADERPRVNAGLRGVVQDGRPTTLEARGAAFGQWLELRAGPSEPGQGDGALLVVVLDITAVKRREARLAFDAVHDPLTGLHNRTAFVERATHALARRARDQSALAVLFIDLDRFKEVNDRHGHAVGDRVLTAVGNRLGGAVRPADTLARIGGDEFVVLCESLATNEEAFGIARRLMTSLEDPVSINPSTEVSLSGTVGIAFAQDRNDDAAALIDRADRAMYQAKDRAWGGALTGRPTASGHNGLRRVRAVGDG
jgi:diguanylate cyclase (GGDEF)-like protein